MIKIISLDLQGTITNAGYSDEFWFELLPMQYSKKYNISLLKSKEKLKKIFNRYGKYDYRYYSVNYWEKRLSFKFDDIMKNKNIPLIVNKELINLTKKYQSIIITTTTFEFIDLELSNLKDNFKKIYSSLDTFNIAGKGKEIYELVAKDLNIETSEILHIGDNIEMDCDNALKAGCKYYYFDSNKKIKEMINEIKKIIKEE